MPGMRRYAIDLNFATGSSRILEDTVGTPPTRREGSIQDIVFFLQQCIASHKCCGCQYCHDESLSLCHVDFGSSAVTVRLSSTCYPFGKKEMEVAQLFDATRTGSVNDRIGLILAACPEYLLFQDVPDNIPLSLPTFQPLNSLKCVALAQTNATLPMLTFIGQLVECSPNLERLILSFLTKNNPFANDVGLYAPIAKGLVHAYSLRHLQLEDLELSDQALAMILTSIGTKRLDTLDLRRNRSGQCTLNAIATILERGGTLNELSLKNQLLPLDLSPLAEPLRRNAALSSLIVSGNQLKDSGMELLMTNLRENTSLKVLRMDHCSIIDSSCFTNGAIHALAEGLPKVKGLTVLDISSATMTENTFRLFALGLQHNSSLQQLWVSDLRLSGAKQFESLFEALRYNNSLSLLDLSQNDFSSESASTMMAMMTTLGESLSVNSTLTSLSLEACLISAHGLRSLARAIPYFQNLRELLADKNELDRNTLGEIVAGVRRNHKLTKLAVGHCVDEDFNVWTKCYKEGRPYPNEYEEILFHLKLNRRGRGLLKNSVPVRLWPKLLESEFDPSIVYFLLREKILLCH